MTKQSKVIYSQEFKDSVMEYEKTHTIRETCEKFKVSKYSINRWKGWTRKSEVVTTCLKACLQYEEHEARENFKYHGVSIFDPHYDVDKLLTLRTSKEWDDVRESH